MASKYYKIMQMQSNYRKKLLKMYPKLTDCSGIYILTRIDEVGIKYAYVGWVYIYCTKGKSYINSLEYRGLKWFWLEDKDVLGVTENSKKATNGFENGLYDRLNGKVVARFWCDKVEEIGLCGDEIDTYFGNKEGVSIRDNACLSFEELENYLGYKHDYKGYAIHISKLEVFDKPMLTTMFRKPEFNKNIYDNNGNRLSLFERLRKYSINKAPQSWQFIEGE